MSIRKEINELKDLWSKLDYLLNQGVVITETERLKFNKELNALNRLIDNFEMV